MNNAIVSLGQAVDAYEAAVITPIAEADLIGHWTFNEGTGTVAADNSANAFNGNFVTGHEGWGAGVPMWSADRHGEEGKAIHFDEGANIEIPYNTKLNPSQMTVSMWVKVDEINANNRFLGLHSWEGYKFQLQEANKPFFTINTSEGIYDRDAEVNGLPVDEWHHIAVTFGGGNMTFYIDGTEVKKWENTPGDAKSISGNPYNVVFGQDFPTDKYAANGDNFDNDKIIPLDWGGYFRGSMDEIRMYKTVLTASQIQSIYDREKP
ncbi:MAG: LamG domain-containing protein [Bacteroidota bacterium]|nr:LamG domain-containing protein [Bacteroidota bacterium]